MLIELQFSNLVNPADTGLNTVAIALPSITKDYLDSWVVQPPYTKLLSATTRNEELTALRAAIEELSKLSFNWDGHSALPISSGVTDNVERFVNSLDSVTPLPMASPNPNGTISLQWEEGTKFAHLEIGKTRFSFYGLRGEERLGAKDGEVTSFGNDIEGTIQSLFCVDKTPSTQITELDYGCSLWAQAA
jgi:hypothetical protein